MEDYSDTVTYDYSDMTPSYPCMKNKVQEFAVAFLPRFYYVIFILSLLGNGMVLFVVIKFERVRTVTNVFLLNLVGSNLVFTCGLPFWAAYQRDQWTFGLPLCKLLGTATYVSINSSVLFLTLLTIDRYLAVVHALAVSQHRKSCYAVAASACVWLLCGLAGVGPLLRYDVTNHWENNLQCRQTQEAYWRRLDVYVHVVVFFLLPLAVVVFCYVRIIVTVVSTQISGKHRTLRIVFVILLLFFVCWTPFNVMQVVEQETQMDCNDAVDYALYITRNVAYLYFCVNPVFYTFLGRKFQNYVRKLLVSYAPCLKGHLSVAATSRSLSHRSPHSLQDQGQCETMQSNVSHFTVAKI
ncbi:C-C chemokine receptor type 4-like [Sardina pilchardus]|uniref:C-C chemokine receptor type 4-like n=1 Tax=Sardina pilchardus TaxID=27697 RepID=UPI002E12FDA0